MDTIDIDYKDIHDFRKEECRWGWNCLDFEITDRTSGKQEARMVGIGRGIKQGQYIMFTHKTSYGTLPVGWKIIWISYKKDPSDMFSADLKYAGIPVEE